MEKMKKFLWKSTRSGLKVYEEKLWKIMKAWRTIPQGHFKNYKLALLEVKRKEIRGDLKTLAHYSKHWSYAVISFSS